MRLLAFVGFAIICCPIMSLTRLTERKSNNHIESRTSSTGNRRQAEKMKKERIPQVDLCQNKGCGACCKGCSTSDGEILSYCQPDGSCKSTAHDCQGPEDLCQNKGCGEECAVSDGALEVVRFCQPDGSCESNASPDCQDQEGTQASSRQALSNIKSTNKEDTPETGSADVPCIQDGIDGICHRGDNPDGGSCCDGLECVDYEPTELNNKCMKCGEKGDKCNSENHRFPRCCAGLKCHEKSMACIRGTVGH